MKRYALIVAGGSGSRMQSDLPKQFLLLNNKPILMVTMEKFAMDSIEIILVLNLDYHQYWIDLCKKYNFSIPHILVKGGRNRFDSVKNGLSELKENAWVAIHDAVRPLISQETISRAFSEAEQLGNAVLAVKSKDSIRRVESNISYSVPREQFYLIQTPQIFKLDVLKEAYKQEFRNEFTDDASVVERLGHSICLVQGEYSNIKITYPEDIVIAETLLKN